MVSLQNSRMKEYNMIRNEIDFQESEKQRPKFILPFCISFISYFANVSIILLT
jgi:hypothetical protein